MRKILTVGLLVENDMILLGMKKRGFGKGRWNGFGGKLHDGESVEDAMKREFYEECRVAVLESQEAGRIDFEFPESGELLEVHFYRILRYSGTAVETEEMRPQWFRLDEIPYEQMWPDDRHWMPFFLERRRFGGSIAFDANDNIIRNDIRETPEA